MFSAGFSTAPTRLPVIVVRVIRTVPLDVPLASQRIPFPPATVPLALMVVLPVLAVFLFLVVPLGLGHLNKGASVARVQEAHEELQLIVVRDHEAIMSGMRAVSAEVMAISARSRASGSGFTAQSP